MHEKIDLIIANQKKVIIFLSEKYLRTKCLHYDSCLICLLSQLFQSKNLACLPSLRVVLGIWETTGKIFSGKILAAPPTLLLIQYEM